MTIFLASLYFLQCRTFVELDLIFSITSVLVGESLLTNQPSQVQPSESVHWGSHTKRPTFPLENRPVKCYLRLFISYMSWDMRRDLLIKIMQLITTESPESDKWDLSAKILAASPWLCHSLWIPKRYFFPDHFRSCL